ncbi:zf-HC2 domain-containing protein [Sphingosinicella sp. LHD-64]|uniref:anti-sigma factor family protein n=1 Tax=Sphingosinicella sp. LHD-64 TaxID=3072139 RepID=UPI00280D413E|nr:zf-HC2 domain-containing protein [Sphingosinicella sp. LHD-64]MDQ8754715.1 zf-HC2 domain-containing protein [Sphingosinicella sp. LHD-64]
MMAITDDRLMAYLDGELDAAARAEVEAALDADAELQAKMETQRKLRARLSARYDPVAEEEVPDHLRAMLEPKVVDLDIERARRARPIWQSVAGIAATLVLGIAIGRLAPGGGSGPVAIENGVMIARGSLETALDTQLASAQAPDGPTRIGVSFAGVDGRLCRTFEDAALSGLACHGAQGWQVMVAAPGSDAQQSDYRQAGSGSPLVLQAAQEMMAGEPLDAEAERRARDAGWPQTR